MPDEPAQEGAAREVEGPRDNSADEFRGWAPASSGVVPKLVSGHIDFPASTDGPPAATTPAANLSGPNPSTPDAAVKPPEAKDG